MTQGSGRVRMALEFAHRVIRPTRDTHLSAEVRKVTVSLEIGAQGEDVASLAAVLTRAFHQPQNVQEVLSHVVILLEKQDHTSVIPGDR